jgi:hypothetical protein
VIVAAIIAGVLAYFVLGIGVVGVGEVIFEHDGTYKSLDNSKRTILIAIWPLAFVVLAAALVVVGVVMGGQALSKRNSLKQIIFAPGEAARRLACATQARVGKKPAAAKLVKDELYSPHTWRK